jgi:hypothetical protein
MAGLNGRGPEDKGPGTGRGRGCCKVNVNASQADRPRGLRHRAKFHTEDTNEGFRGLGRRRGKNF